MCGVTEEMIKEEEQKQDRCPAIEECEENVTQDKFRSFCMSKDYKLCIAYQVKYGKKKKPREWLKEEISHE